MIKIILSSGNDLSPARHKAITKTEDGRQLVLWGEMSVEFE